MSNTPNGQNIYSVLKDPSKLVALAQNELSRMFRTMLNDLEIGSKKFTNLTNKYLDNPHNGVKSDRTSRNNNRGNLMKELSNPNMSWNVFMKSIRFLGAYKFAFIMRITRKVGTEDITTEHVLYAENFPRPEDEKEVLQHAKIIPNLSGEEESK
nr:MAG TPA: hypothetical protein [Caudoviricetes sp.]